MTALTNRKNDGFTIIELMVALALSVVLTVGTITVVSNTSTSFKHNDARSRIQENARFALEFLSYDLRQAGFFGCSLGTPVAEEMIEGFDGQGDGETSDAITVRYSDSSGAMFEIPTPPTPGTKSIDLFHPGTLDPIENIEELFSVGQHVTVADCGNVEWAKIESISGNTIVLKEPLENAYNAITQLRLLGSYAYAVSVRSEDNVPVLVRSVNGGDPEELVEGVEYLRFLYGIDDNGDRVADEFRSDSSLTGGEFIVSIKIGMVIRSNASNTRPENSGGQIGTKMSDGTHFGKETPDGTYTVLDKDVTLPEIRGTRQVFTSALMVRNQL